MGVIDWFKRGVGEMMVARPDDAKSQVVWKHPDPTIPLKSQLTVEADERAVFFRDGKVVATLGPGRHTLETSNLPFLSNLLDSFTGGNVFIAEEGPFITSPLVSPLLINYVGCDEGCARGAVGWTKRPQPRGARRTAAIPISGSPRQL
jgi:hypothetical protein